MKLTSNAKFKLWLTVTLSLIVVGMIILGVFGFNQTVDYSDSYELNVKVEKNLGEANSIMTEKVEEFFNEKGIEDATYGRQQIADGEVLVYKFTADNVLFQDKTVLQELMTELENKIETAFNEKGGEVAGLQVEVNAYSATHYLNQKVWRFVIAISIAIVVMFIYVLIMEKVAGALTVLCTSVTSGVLTMAILALARIPAYPYLFATITASAMLASVISIGIVNRAKEISKNVANEGMSSKEVVESATKLSLLRIVFMAIALLIVALLLIIIGTGMLKLVGLHIIVIGATSIFTSYGFTEIFYGLFKKNKK